MATLDNSIKDVFSSAASLQSEDDFIDLLASLMAYYSLKGYESGHAFDIPHLKSETDKRLEALAAVKEPTLSKPIKKG